MIFFAGLLSVVSAGSYLADKKDGAYFMAIAAIFVLFGESMGVQW